MNFQVIEISIIINLIISIIIVNMSTLQSNSTLENKPIDNTVSDANVLAIRELIRCALRENPFLTLEQFIQQTNKHLMLTI